MPLLNVIHADLTPMTCCLSLQRFMIASDFIILHISHNEIMHFFTQCHALRPSLASWNLGLPNLAAWLFNDLDPFGSSTALDSGLDVFLCAVVFYLAESAWSWCVHGTPASLALHNPAR